MYGCYLELMSDVLMVDDTLVLLERMVILHSR